MAWIPVEKVNTSYNSEEYFSVNSEIQSKSKVNKRYRTDAKNYSSVNIQKNFENLLEFEIFIRTPS